MRSTGMVIRRSLERTGSGNFHAWYRHDGEARLIRPDPDKPIDILGSGFVVAPPSQGAGWDYSFIEGGLDDVDRLPALRGLPPKITARTEFAAPLRVEPVDKGTRNKTFYGHCMRNARSCDDLNALLDVARTRNAEFSQPLPDCEVMKTAKSAWGYTERDENWFGSGRRVAFPHTTVDRLAAQDPYAYALLSVLKRYHGGRDQFALAKEMANKLGWSLPAFKTARKRLEDDGEIRCISRGGRGAHDPPQYGWK